MAQLTKEESNLLLSTFVTGKFEIEGKLIFPLALALQKLQQIINEPDTPKEDGE